MSGLNVSANYIGNLRESAASAGPGNPGIVPAMLLWQPREQVGGGVFPLIIGFGSGSKYADPYVF